jgi:hypothetical protein
MRSDADSVADMVAAAAAAAAADTAAVDAVVVQGMHHFHMVMVLVAVVCCILADHIPLADRMAAVAAAVSLVVYYTGPEDTASSVEDMEKTNSQQEAQMRTDMEVGLDRPGKVDPPSDLLLKSKQNPKSWRYVVKTAL